MTAVLLTILFAAVADSPTLEGLEKEIIEHIQSYDGLEFSIQSSFHFVPSKGDESRKFALPQCRETIRLHFPEKDSIHKSWKYWVQEVPDKSEGQWIIDCFKVTDGAKTHKFRYTPETKGRWSNGSITPWYEWSENEGRTFFTFLGMNSFGMSLLDFDLSDDMKNRVWAETLVRFVKEGECDGVKTFVFQGENTGCRCEVHYLSKGGMVVHAKRTEIKENHSTVYHVDKLGTFEGIYYPKSGYHREMPLRLIGKTDYQFEVTAVKRYDKELLENWFPEWPSATSVHDVATDKVTLIPPSEIQQLQNLNRGLDKDLFRKIAPYLLP